MPSLRVWFFLDSRDKGFLQCLAVFHAGILTWEVGLGGGVGSVAMLQHGTIEGLGHVYR